MRWLQSLANVAWRTGAGPEDWRKALVIPVHMKGSRMQSTNYRGISLHKAHQASHMLEYQTIVFKASKLKVLEKQGAFRMKRSCFSLVFPVRQLQRV